MSNDPYTIPTAWKTRLKLFFGSAVIFASMASAGQAQDIYPQIVPQAQTADVVRPTVGPYMSRCTQLEVAAGIGSHECGTFTLSEVVTRMHILQGDDHDK
jgi:hypothetical protein